MAGTGLNAVLLHDRRPSIRISKNTIIIIVLFILYPIVSLPLVFSEIYKGKRYAYSLLAIFIGYFAFLYPPAGDLYRYREDYILYYRESFSTFLTYLTFKLDFLFSFLLYFLGKLDVPCDFSRFIYTWIASDCLFQIFYDKTKTLRISSPNKVFLLFIIYWLYVNFIVLMYRYGFSSALFATGYYYLYYKNQKITAIVFISLAVLNHFSYIIFALCIIVQKLFAYYGNKWISIVGILWALFFSFDFLTPIIEAVPLPDYIKSHLLAYTNGFWAQEFLADQSFKNIILTWLNKLRLISLFVIYVLYFKKSPISGFLTMGTVMLMFASISGTISTRFEIALLLPFLLFFFDLVMENQLKNFKFVRKVFIVIGLLFIFASVWSHRREYSISYEYKLLFPTAVILPTTYSQSWVDNHIDNKGEPIGLY